MVKLQTFNLHGIRNGWTLAGRASRPHPSARASRPLSLSTRFACLGLFCLSMTLAGAASKVVQGMSQADDYAPALVALRSPEYGPCSDRDPEEFLVVMADFDDPAGKTRSDQPPPPPRPVLTPARPTKPQAKGKSESKPAAPAPAAGTSAPKPPNAAKSKADSPPPAPLPPPPLNRSKVIPIRNKAGQRVIARVYGEADGRVAVILPDGQIGFADGIVNTDAPFVPATMDEMREQLLAGEYADFKVCQTKHYLVFYGGSERFAKASAKVLEDLYTKLGNALLKQGFAVYETEFPLVAVIYATEDEFRARKKIGSEVQAYYEILSNRIFMYEKSNKDKQSPEMALLRKPQTVAHEGSHQILQNIGVQPRLADWPLWLVEGFAEYCSPPKVTKTGVDWAGLNQINPLHMATIRDLQDPLPDSVRGGNSDAFRRMSPGQSWIQTLVAKRDLTPTDYALSWALTHYLANKRLPEFLEYLREMSQRPPLERRSGEDHLADFQQAFGDNLTKLDGAVTTYLSKIKKFDVLPYYLVMFEQPFQSGATRRASMVSQSPSMIYQWIDGASNPRGGAPRWQIVPHPTRARAILAAEEWMRSGQ